MKVEEPVGFGPTHGFWTVYLFSKEAPYSRLGMTPCQSGPPGLGWAAVRYLPHCTGST